METTWTPQTACWSPIQGCNENFVIRSFVVTGFEDPEILSPLKEVGGITVVDVSDRRAQLYKLSVDEKVYDIEYSIEPGHIKSIAFDRPVTTLSVRVEGVYKDTELFMKIPRELVAEILSCGGRLVPYDYPLEVFIDTVPAGSVEVVAGESTTWNIPLEAGAQEIAIVGTCLI